MNLKAAINLMQIVGKKMVLNGKGGSIVNITSVLGTLAMKEMMAYCVTKAGLNVATKVFALELGPNKIRVNSVAPTSVKTKMFEMNMGEALINRYNSMIPIGCIKEVEDVVQCVQFHLSDQSKMITGTTITVDGGHTCYLPV